MLKTLEFRRANVRKEMPALMRADARIFPAGDRWDEPELFEGAKCYWIVVDGKKAGWLAFYHNMAFIDGVRWKCTGCLYLGTLGLFKGFRGRGIGELAKAWQIQYAREHGFRRISTNARKKTSAASIHLNKKFGFRVVREMRGYWDDGEPNVVLSLNLKHRNRR
jgi:GNAT superfamily N-acetyltransferase